jgi:endonuclease/exonuclease/phosphatase (EEP) superfamily protein YafD
LRTFARRAITALVVVTAVPTLLGLLDRWTPYFELATLFRPQYAALLGVAAIAAALLHYFRLTLVALLLVAVNVVVVIRVPETPAAAETGTPRLRVLVANVEYGNHDYERLVSLVADADPDLVAITELTSAWARHLDRALDRHPHRRLAPEEGAYGAGFYSKGELGNARVVRLPRSGSPSVIATVAIGRRQVEFVVTHVHTPFAGNRRTEQLAALGRVLEERTKPAVVCGDFNAAPWSQPIHELADSASLGSVYGRLGLTGTWPASWIRFLRTPLDNCLVSEEIAVADQRVGPDIGSDHLPLILDLGLSSANGD